ncbi:dethiobiotin synthase [Arsukibacterium sp.]|uniref:dethiobiotin synthase n=1 Tax=Arsukibacterium sp. TaxID=1977258 RepID=UPI00299D8021|nr:dethiobiotin synthase [Arsukibacterium sp.]MDX1678358.1 dethiobiotin synthase [Arsukibacterium sp.]
MAVKSLFITATDTDAGKTFVSCLLLQGLAARSEKAVGVKPIAAGTNDQNQNGDALLLQRHSGIALPYQLINPICYQAPVAPHLAAVNEQQPISEAKLDQTLEQWQQLPLQWLLIEGAGGWLLPLDGQRYLADWVAKQQLPVVLIVGMKLGCLNHAMLTVREIARSGCQLLGWVANCVDPDMALAEQNIADLQQRIPAPCLGVVPYRPDNNEQVALNLASSLLRTSGCNTR